jgi:hypothetical protein
MSYPSFSKLFRAVVACTATAVVGLLCVAPASAQWVHYPTAGIPRTKDGCQCSKMCEPVPRSANWCEDSRTGFTISEHAVAALDG